MSDYVIEIKNASKKYKTDENSFYALREINLQIKKGEFVSIVGPSGSGKSTLLHLLGCLDTPTSGEVDMDGISVSKMNEDELAEVRNKKIGFVFQAFNLSPVMNVFKNVELPLVISEMEENERERKVREYLNLVGLSHRQHNKPSQLSGGEKQRVAIARALVNSPQIILADEPTGNLDSKSGKDIMDFLFALWKKANITIVIVTHEPVVAAYSERVIHIRDGRIEKDLKQKPLSPQKIENIKIKEVLA